VQEKFIECHDVSAVLGKDKNGVPEIWFYIKYDRDQGQFLDRADSSQVYVVDGGCSPINAEDTVAIIRKVQFLRTDAVTKLGGKRSTVLTLMGEFSQEQLAPAEEARIEMITFPL
jgi:hypothetical protein